MSVTPRSGAGGVGRRDSASPVPAPVYAPDMPMPPRPMRPTSSVPRLMCFMSVAPCSGGVGVHCGSRIVQSLPEPRRVGDGRAAVVVVEVREPVDAFVAPVAPPRRGAPEPAPAVPAGVFLLQCVRSVEADVGPVGRQYPRRTREQVVYAERGAGSGERPAYVVVQPRGIAQL